MRVLLIEDNCASARSIKFMLKSASFTVHTARLGDEGVDLGELSNYDIIVLDLSMPDMSGLGALRSLKVTKGKTPILILFGLADMADEVKGLGFGPSDYMIKPIHKDELVARMHATVRRSKGCVRPVMNTGDLVINLEDRTVAVAGTDVHVTEKEFEVLELLFLRKGTTLTKEMFLNHLYGGLDEPNLQVIDVFICNLRKKLASASNGKRYIETVWGRGYILRETVDDDAKNSALPVARMASKAFGPEDVKAMVSAYEDALNALRVTDRTGPLKELLAKNIIDLAMQGERDPVRLREIAFGATAD